MVVRYRLDSAPVIVDVGGGYGGGVTVRLKDNGIEPVSLVASMEWIEKTKDGQLAFANKRAEVWWKFREALDPDQPDGSAIALPPDPELRADLCAPTWKLTARGILLESKDEVRNVLHSSGAHINVQIAQMQDRKAIESLWQRRCPNLVNS